MTYLQQQQQPPPLPPHALATQHKKHLNQQQYQQQDHHVKAPALQHHQQQRHSKGAETTYPHALQKRAIDDTQEKTSNHSSGHHLGHPGTGSRISSPHSPRDQTIDEELTTTLLSQAKGVAPTHDQFCLPGIKVPLDGAHHIDKEDHSDYGDDSCHDDEDDSEHSEDVVDENGDDDEISEMDDSESDYVSDDGLVETEQLIPAPSGFGTVSPDQNNSDSAQRDQQELLRQLTIAASAWSSSDSNGAAHNSSADAKADLSDYRRSAPSNVSGHEHRVVVQEAPLDETSQIHSQHTTPIFADGISHGTTPLTTSPDTGVSEQEHGLQPSAVTPNLRDVRMVQYVDEEESDDYEEESDDEGSEYDDGEDEDDYSYSEDDGEDEDEDESPTEYHHGAREDPQARAATKGRSSQSGHYSRSGYPHYRPPKLDFLRKRDIAKQVVRRSSLTAMFGEVSQPETEQRVPTARPSAGTAFGQYQRHSGTTVRRPALSSVWMEAAPTKVTLPPSDANKRKPNSSSDTQAQTAIAPCASMISDQDRPVIVGPASVISDASQRPRRTDSGVGVKLSPNQRSGPATSDSNSELQSSRFVVTKLSNESTSHHPSAAETSTTASIVIESARRLRIKSEGDSPEQGSLRFSSSVGCNSQAGGSSGSASGSKSLQVRKPLKSSISCHTFPRAAGKRLGQKHVSWHHSLFPTEHVLRVKPSLPSLSSVAAESAEAKLSQLPSVPVMARDNVMAFHQSIRSLRTLSRTEIARMSYKQQGRQELTSPMPISKSVHDSIPWWSPTRWFKGSVEIDKRHWKVTYRGRTGCTAIN
ncbi:hypothetical protein BGZ58_000865 [Dissophora ornata]|nr:hypothetical protein BGZ58_000865 [Dissophora ornata]